MKITPRSEKEIKYLNLWDKGLYAFEILDAVERISKSGNEMIELVLKIHNKDNKVKQIYDHLLNIDTMAYKLRHLCYAANLGKEYDSGLIESYMFIGKIGILELTISKDKDKNSVKDYVVKDFEDDNKDEILPF